MKQETVTAEQAPPPLRAPQKSRASVLLIAGIIILIAVIVIAGIVTAPALFVAIPFFATPTPTYTPTYTPTSTSTPTPTHTPTSTLTPTPTPTPTITPTYTPTLRPEGNCSDPGAQFADLSEGQRVNSTFKVRGTASVPDFAYYVIYIYSGGIWQQHFRSLVPVTNSTLIPDNRPLPVGAAGVKLVVFLKSQESLAPCQYMLKVE